MADIDPVEYGKLVQAVENLESKVSTMEYDIKKLVAMAERSKGSCGLSWELPQSLVVL